MASSMIHIAVANEVNKKLNRNKRELLIGSIAPDISKLLNQSKLKSHFLDDIEADIPNIDKFLIKYKNNLNDDFVMGYYIHLYTDYLWRKYFFPEIYDNNTLTKLNGEKFVCTDKEMQYYIYNDYTNLNIKLIDKFDLDLAIFYEEIPTLNDIIKEIPMDKINLIIEKAGIIIANTKENKEYTFNVDNIEKFINTSTDLIIANIEEINN